MTGWLFASALIAGVAAGEAWFRIRRANDRTNWILRGQEQAELTHRWHPAVSGEVAVAREPKRRFRPEQDLQPPARPARPVFYDDPR